MSKIKDTVSIEAAKRLDTAGITFDCEYCYDTDGKLWRTHSSNPHRISAPQLHNILDKLPKSREIDTPECKAEEFLLYMIASSKGYTFYYYRGEVDFFSENPADACAELLIWVTEKDGK